MNQLTKVFENTEIRIVGDDSNPLFVLNDVCRVLDLSNPSVVKSRLDEGVSSTYTLHTPGGWQEVTVIDEDGLYDVILDSRKPQAKRFRKWVTGEVLPSIRKTGNYELPQLSPTEITLRLAQQQADQENRLQTLENKVDNQITLNHAEQLAIENAKKKRVERLWDNLEGQSDLYDTKRKLYARMGSDLKRAFIVASYRDIKRKDFDEALNYIKAWRPALV